ncbi:putative disease resistance protein [Cinnamomum micranthum f. kanehirae]|uniref:Putative disease resistance protein n=1 Tax=Cinnamomum micranthum f. kanehirae TaxID=337451 RepID=A0A443Q3Z9_9MAGN|nr:putative disease resistance protein [Cinnamomum micranthum f. kanehirae]
MASEAIVSFLVERLGDLLIKEAQLLHGVHDQFRWIQRELDSMRCFLKEADSKQNEDAGVKNWVTQIRDVSYDAEDVIEIFIYSQRRSRGFVGRVKRYIYIYIFSELRTRHKVAQQIKKIKLDISDISRRRKTYGITNINLVEASSSSQSLQEHRRLSTALEDSEVVGLQDEVIHVRKQLMTWGPRRHVISIFGMGGLGKTTLAKKVYHDVKKQFDCHAFIYLSQQFSIKDVLMRIIKCLTSRSQEVIEQLNLEELSTMLHGDLKEKRYLVVIDDIWSIEAWEKLNLILPAGMKGSRVMLTTRFEEVASHASGHPHKMRFLTYNEGRELFMKKIFPGEDPLIACPLELEKIGRKILAKCGDLPLAILVLGGLLARKDKTECAWSKVLESIPESSKQCLDILALSYWDLPHYLKPCFLYFGLFPEDYEISSGKLIRLWIAEGFIRQKGNKLMEDAAEDYLEELVSRSMIQIAKKRSNGSIHKYRIHDLLRELSISEARENNFFVVHNDNDSSSSSTSVRRLAFYRNIVGYETKNHSIKNIRSILYFFDSNVDVLKLPNTTSKLLRVMNVELEKFSTVSIPKEVGEFVHLKFWNFQELRHLHAYSHIEGRPHLSNLRNLQTLRLRAGGWIEEGLGKLTNLRKLRIFGDVSSYHDTLPYCIEKLRNLRSLKLTSWRPIPPFMPFTHHLDLYKIYLCGSIKKLQELPPNLVQLHLYGSELEQDVISTLEKLQHLKILRLYLGSYLSTRMICSPGGFPRLELLELSQLPLEEWIVEEGAMKSLKSVELSYMSELNSVPKRVRALVKRN